MVLWLLILVFHYNHSFNWGGGGGGGVAFPLNTRFWDLILLYNLLWFPLLFTNFFMNLGFSVEVGLIC